MELIERWWNGQWGIWRRDVWLVRLDTAYGVQWREGGAEQGTQRKVYTAEQDARAAVDGLLAEGRWRNITEVSSAPE